MGKRLLNLYVEDSQIEQCKARGINMSALFRCMIDAEMEGNDASALQRLKLKLAKATKEITELNKQLIKANKAIQTKKLKEEGWQKPIQQSH